MVNSLTDRSLSQQQAQSAANAPDVLAFFMMIFRSDVRFKVVLVLAKREGACLSEIARNVGMSHKNLAKYLEVLMQNGIVEAYSVGMRDRVYRLANKYSFLRQLL
jgi:predicted transcriptional regulator